MLNKLKEFKNKKIEEARLKKYGDDELENEAVVEVKRQTQIKDELDDLMKLRQKHQQRIRIKTFTKNSLKVVLLILLISAIFRGLTLSVNKEETVDRNIANRTALIEYSKNYFVYPSTQYHQEQLALYAVKDFEKPTVSNDKVINMQLENVEVMDVEKTSNQHFVYYMKAVLRTQLKDNDNKEKTEWKTIHYRLETYEDLENIVITKPIVLLEKPKTKINETLKASLQEKLDALPKGKGSLSEEEIKQLGVGVDLFLKTYSEDKKNTVLMTEGDILLPLSPGTKLKFKSIKNAIKVDKELYLLVEVEESFQQQFVMNRIYAITMNQESKKIKKMEVR